MSFSYRLRENLKHQKNKQQKNKSDGLLNVYSIALLSSQQANRKKNTDKRKKKRHHFQPSDLVLVWMTLSTVPGNKYTCVLLRAWAMSPAQTMLRQCPRPWVRGCMAQRWSLSGRARCFPPALPNISWGHHSPGKRPNSSAVRKLELSPDWARTEEHGRVKIRSSFLLRHCLKNTSSWSLTSLWVTRILTDTWRGFTCNIIRWGKLYESLQTGLKYS